MKKALLITLAVILLLLQYRLWFGDGGILQIHSVKQAQQVQRQQNEVMRERNEDLAAEVNDLKQGTAAIEERARSELGMIRQGEVFYQTVEPPPNPAQPPPATVQVPKK
ncbi:MAG: cell division protein FtsB [Gammaproteobacteria bacterium]|nr:cell division protein FtsB [Gammaproteobacteria bacterium]